jgi:hypothetical protein
VAAGQHGDGVELQGAEPFEDGTGGGGPLRPSENALGAQRHTSGFVGTDPVDHGEAW